MHRRLVAVLGVLLAVAALAGCRSEATYKPVLQGIGEGIGSFTRSEADDAARAAASETRSSSAFQDVVDSIGQQSFTNVCAALVDYLNDEPASDGEVAEKITSFLASYNEYTSAADDMKSLSVAVAADSAGDGMKLQTYLRVKAIQHTYCGV